MPTIEPGEIRLIDAQVIEPDKTQRLGRSLLNSFSRSGGVYSQQSLSTSNGFNNVCNDDRVSRDARNWLNQILDADRALLESSGQEFERLYLTLLAGGGLAWHLDRNYDFRFVHNLGAGETTVDIATEWDRNLYSSGEFSYVEPVSSEPLIVGVNQTYVSNNLVLDPCATLRPHSTPDEPSRLTLKVNVDAVRGWQETATGVGIPINIG